MRHLSRLVSLTSLSLLTSAALLGCSEDPDGSIMEPPDVMIGPVVEITQDITASTVWSGARTYILKSQIFVTNGTLTIEPGAVIKGEAGSVLAITRNARLHAVGTVDRPIVFTSGSANPAKAGDWGGLVLLGSGPHQRRRRQEQDRRLPRVAGGQDRVRRHRRRP